MSEKEYKSQFTGAQIDDRLAKAQQAYTMIMNQQTKLEDKADKATTLAGYGILDTYTKDQVNELISKISSFEYVIADTLPVASSSTMGKIYFIPSSSSKDQNIKDEYMTFLYSGVYSWEQLGSTSVDLSNYRKASDQDIIDNTKYEKPSAGIPKSDLADDVQTSLGKADTALQEQDISGKQDKLIAGDNITIGADGKTISATGGTAIVDNLDSDSATSALSAKQGKVLKGLVDAKANQTNLEAEVTRATEAEATKANDSEVVKVVSQSLSTSDQEQVQDNIGIRDAIKAVEGVNISQSVTKSVDVTAGIALNDTSCRFVMDLEAGHTYTISFGGGSAISTNVAGVLYWVDESGNQTSLGNFYSWDTVYQLTPSAKIQRFFISMSAGRVTGSGTLSLTASYEEKETGLTESVSILTTKVASITKQENTSRYIHLSFDDVTSSLQSLASGSYTSIFDVAIFKFCKKMHDTYGAVFSFYCFNDSVNPTTGAVLWSIESLPTTYIDEFKANSDWMRFGFHADNRTTNFNDTTAEDATSQYNRMTSALVASMGINSVDRVVRLQGFVGNVNACKAIRDANCGILGLLTSDNDRADYYLSTDDYSWLHNHDRLIDYTNRLAFIKTDIRFEYYADSTISGYIEDFDTLLSSLEGASMGNKSKEIIAFTHEGFFGISSYKIETNIEKLCSWGVENGYNFRFPMDMV